MRRHGEQVRPGLVHPADDEVGTDVTLVLEEVLFEHGHGRHDLGFTAGGECVQLRASASASTSSEGTGGDPKGDGSRSQRRITVKSIVRRKTDLDIARDQIGDEFRISGGPSPATPDMIGNIMNLSDRTIDFPNHSSASTPTPPRERSKRTRKEVEKYRPFHSSCRPRWVHPSLEYRHRDRLPLLPPNCRPRT